ncbi:MAG TPA: tRNA pseudouridine(38-40) synthase TruA [Chryseosolibacter sp.]|nr:tRNA pseudouridine(38-40) synthase TruA [Chryseosolibacter sp.]
MRYFFEVAYNGSNYSGWQSQKNAIGIQSVIEDALSKLLQQQIGIIASGRTDAGVHCEQQFFHADIGNPFDNNFLIRLNSFLPQQIVINNIQPVRADASARYDAYERSYRYQITRKKNPFYHGYAWHFFKAIDIKTMNAAAALLLGERDFESFSKVKTDVNHFICTIRKATWEENDDLLCFHITANRFLRGMVRAIVGTLLDVGTGKIKAGDFESIITSRDRRKAGANVPAEGLFLTGVKYMPDIFI